jgi:hypothetical protein
LKGPERGATQQRKPAYQAKSRADDSPVASAEDGKSAARFRDRVAKW